MIRLCFDRDYKAVEIGIAEDRLDGPARTANAKDCAAHMDLIQGLLQRVSYEGLKLRTLTPANVLFKIKETVEGSDGTVNHQGGRDHCPQGTRWQMAGVARAHPVG